MGKRFYLSIACAGAVFSLFATNANEEIARGEQRGGGGGYHGDNRSYNHNDRNVNQDRRQYDRYENHGYNGYNRYDQNRWNNNGAYDEGIIDGVLINNTYNPDVEYTPPGSTDNFNEVYEENLK